MTLSTRSIFCLQDSYSESISIFRCEIIWFQPEAPDGVCGLHGLQFIPIAYNIYTLFKYPIETNKTKCIMPCK